MRIAPFQAILPNLRLISSFDRFFKTVKEAYAQYAAHGFFQKAAQESIYVYRIEQEGRAHWGYVCAVHIEDYLQGHIKPHEHTLAQKEQQQLHLMLQRKAQVKPVLLTWQGQDNLLVYARRWAALHDPTLDLELDTEDSRHTLWAISDGAAIRQVQDEFSRRVSTTYIADGHHRSKVVAMLYERAADADRQSQFEWLLAACFPTDQLRIWDYNRVIDTRNEISFTRFLARLSEYCDITYMDIPHQPRAPHYMTLFLANEWYALRWKSQWVRPVQPQLPVLDVDLFNRYVLGDILGIMDVRHDKRVSYVAGRHGLEGLKEKVLKNEHRMGFCLYPVAMEDFLTISDAGCTLPPKSTWFEPRMKNGLIVKELML